MPETIDYNYRKVHHYLVRTFGQATKCENENCEKPQATYFEYALIKSLQYECKRENFIMLCASCHRKYDYTEEQRQKIIADRSKKYKVIHQFDKNGNFIAEFQHTRQAAKLTKVNRTNILMCIKNKRPSAGGFIWRYKNGSN